MKYKALSVLIVLALAVGVFGLGKYAQKKLAAQKQDTVVVGVGGNPIQTNPRIGVNTTSTVSSTVVSVLAANNSRQLLIMANLGVSDIYWSATTTNLVFGSGALLRASSTLTLSGDSLWTGAIYAVSNNTTTLSFLQL